MKLLNILFFSILFSILANAQISKKMELLAHWDADTFPLVFAGQYSDCWGITAPNGKEYAVIGSTPYIHFFDITNDANPVEVAHFAGGTTSLWREFKSYKDHVYAVADQGQEGLIIFDCKNAPNIVKTKQTTEFSARTHMPFIDEKNGRLYLAGTNTQNGGLIVLDLTKDPDNPTLLSSVALPGGYVHDLHVKDNIAYCSHGNNGLWIYDFTDPANPVLLGNMTSYPESGYNHSTWLTKDDKYLIQCDETHNTSVKVVDIQNLNDIKVVDLFKSTLLAPTFTNSIGHNPYIRGDYSIISYYHDGVQVYDVSNPTNVKNVAWYDTEPNNINYDGYDGMWGVYPFFESDKIVCSDLNNGLFIVKLTDIDLDDIHTTGLPEPKLNHTGVVKICQGSSVTLSIPAGAQFINWYKDGEMIQSSGVDLIVDQPGNYKAVTWSHSNIKESEIVKVAFSNLNNPTLAAENGEVGFCPGESVKLCSNSSVNEAKWLLNGVEQMGNGNCFSANQGGTYQQIAIDGLCEKASNEVTISEYDAPSSTISPSVFTICPNESIELTVTTDANKWTWFLNGVEIPNNNQPTYNASTKGTYTVLIENEHCSTNSESAKVIEATPVKPEITADVDTLSSTSGSFYQWYLNGMPIPNADQQKYVATKSGNYFVEVTDINGCITVSDEVKIIVTLTSDAPKAEFYLYPNPTSYILNINFGTSDKFTTWTITSLSGTTLKSGTFKNVDQDTISLDDLNSGMYILICHGQESKYSKFIKK